MEEGQIEVDSIQPIGFPDITSALARESGFLDPGTPSSLSPARSRRRQRIRQCKM
jgi:hypothetical protein